MNVHIGQKAKLNIATRDEYTGDTIPSGTAIIVQAKSSLGDINYLVFSSADGKYKNVGVRLNRVTT